ncbi:ABC transporter ATP-binding protein, partial [Nostoc sp. UCD122]|nr:ABC transporter ATP-binding protein [Nostoc sp. UCD122]
MTKSRRITKLAAYLRPHWREAALGILALLSVNGLGVYIPWLIRACVDLLSTNFSWNQILRYVVVII